MTPGRIQALLSEVAAGRLSVAEAQRDLAWLPVEEMGIARLDHHRLLRQGFPEVVYGEGKSPDQLAEITARLAARGDGVLATRVSAEGAVAALERLPGEARYDPLSRTLHLPSPHASGRAARGTVLVVSAGTSDLPVAEEAAVTAEAFGNPVGRLVDVGVAGIHRVLAEREQLHEAAVVIVVAGMEGALPSVVGGLVRAPVIAVPTSVGYGASFGGVSALLGMLNSCAAGVTVVNIDNGFGAACAASRINLAADG